ncbi:MAG: hypothetical protein K0R06_111 [Clostridium sp.]|jgi:hypothetical protein|nr:hypothetical protein [Clostridium sp.]
MINLKYLKKVFTFFSEMVYNVKKQCKHYHWLGMRGVIMSQCPFLSTYDKEIECFENCAFYKLEETNGECPFKSITCESKYKLKRIHYNYYMEDEEDLFDFDEGHKKVDYI